MRISLMGFWVLFSLHILFPHERIELKESSAAFLKPEKTEKNTAFSAPITLDKSMAIDTDSDFLDCPARITQINDSISFQLLQVQPDEQDATFESKCEHLPTDFDPALNPYAITSFTVNKTGFYTFELDTDFENTFGAIILKGNDLCKDIVALSKSKPMGLGFLTEKATPQIKVFLTAEKSYFLLTGSLSTSETTIENTSWVAYGRGEVSGVSEVKKGIAAFELVCTDIDSVIDNVQTLFQFGTIADTTNLNRIILNDLQSSGGGCEADTLKRRIISLKKEKNPDTCRQNIVFRKPGLEDVILPPKMVHFSCDEQFTADDNGNPAPSIAGFPAIQTAYGVKVINGQYCSLLASYQDVNRDFTCDDTYIITREWFILDWCGGEENTISFTQLIKIGDTTPPQFDIPLPIKPAVSSEHPDTLVVSTGPFNCTATFSAPLPTNITDNCSASTTTKILLKDLSGDTIGIQGSDENDQIIIADLEIGDYLLVYELKDACFNKASKEILLQVRDRSAPVAICNDEFNISIGGDGIGTVAKEDISEGTWDNCTTNPAIKVRREIRVECIENYIALTNMAIEFDSTEQKYYSTWGDKVFFTCCDVDKSVRIELSVTDDSGNENSCWQDIFVDDKAKPECTPPAAISVDCETFAAIDITDEAQLQSTFGIPVIEDNMCEAFFTEFDPLFLKEVCNTGTLTRKFIGTDLAGNESDTCYQEITITEVHNYEIKFPRDVSNYDCTEPLVDTLEVRELGCDVLAIEIDTFVFEADGSSCQEWRIRHRVINWCEFDDNPEPFRISRNEDRDDDIGEDSVFVLVRPEGAFIDSNRDEKDGVLREVESRGFWEYTQIITLLDSISPQIIPDDADPFCITSDSCTGEVDYFFTLFDLCDSRSLDITVIFDENKNGEDMTELDDSQITGRVPKFRISGDFPEGEHCFRVEVSDGCGNVVRTQLPFEVVDCKAPAPVCIQQLAVELMPVVPPRDIDGNGSLDRGANVIWADDFKPVVNTPDCSPGIRYSINRAGETPNIDSTALTLTCDDLGLVQVEIYAWDSAMNPLSVQPDGTMGGPNYDFCTGFIVVQDNRFNLCDTTSSLAITGNVSSFMGAPVNDVAINVSGANTTQVITDDNGVFMVDNMQLGYDYTLSPYLNEAPMDGVTTFDLVLISKHILGEGALDNPYQLIAADINKSASISSMDLIQLRKLILSIDSGFPNNTSWRFIDANYEFSDDQTEWLSGFPEWININNFNPDEEKPHDFIAIKVGDVNTSNSILRNYSNIEQRSDMPSTTLAIQQTVINQNEGRVALSFEEASNLSGFQFTIAFDPKHYRLTDVAYSSLITPTNIGYKFINDGLLVVSYNGALKSEDEAEELLILEFESLTKSVKEQIVTINSRLLEAEAYSAQNELMAIKTSFEMPAGDYFKVISVHPNPAYASQGIFIDYFTPTAQAIKIEIIDVQGREILSINQNVGIGQHRFASERFTDLKPGLYFYKITAGKSGTTGSILIIE